MARPKITVKTGQTITWNSAIVVSIVRLFGVLLSSSPFTWLSAFEVIGVGLLTAVVVAVVLAAVFDVKPRRWVRKNYLFK